MTCGAKTIPADNDALVVWDKEGGEGTYLELRAEGDRLVLKVSFTDDTELNKELTLPAFAELLRAGAKAKGML